MAKKKGCKEIEEKVVDEKLPDLYDYEIKMVLSGKWWSQKNFTDPVTKFSIITGPGNAKTLPDKMSYGLEHAIMSGILLPVAPKIEILRKEKPKGNYNGC